MTEGKVPDTTEGAPEASEGELTDWITTRPVPDVVDRVTAIRALVPATAIRTLQTFALKRPIDDLNELDPDNEIAGHFSRLDATIVLALAALARPVEDAAKLAIGRWTKEATLDRAATRLITDSIVHDVTAQRTVPEVAKFIRVCRQDNHDELVQDTLRVFAGTGSGRTDLDRSLLHIALKDEQCDGDADELLRLSLHGASARVVAAGADGTVEVNGIVGALHHLSPSMKILETWVDAEMDATRESEETINLVANLLVGEPTGAKSLAEHVGGNWSADSLGDLCKNLIGRSPARFATICEYMATRTERKDLAEIITCWYKAPVLSGTLDGLLARIVASGDARHDGSRNPRSSEFIEALDDTLRRAPQRCRAMLRIAVAKHVADRSGEDIARLLGRVEGPRDLKHTAEEVNEHLVDRVFNGEIPATDFIDYIKGLQGLKRPSSLTFLAVRELSDPKGPDRALEKTAATVGEIVAGLFDKKLDLDKVAFELLERFLENEQAVTANAAVTIVDQVRTRNDEMRADPRWKSLFGATVGRWADVDNREKVITAFGRFSKEGDAITQSMQ
jgi:hypothetical protein